MPAVRKISQIGRPIDVERLIRLAGSSKADNAQVIEQAWHLLRGHLPATIAEKFPQGGFLDATLDLCEAHFGSKLEAWTLEYTSCGGPYRASLHLCEPGRTLIGVSGLSAAGAFVVALLQSQVRTVS